MAKKFLWWNELPAHDVREYSKECDIAMLPLGSIEQHGPHCPSGDEYGNGTAQFCLLLLSTGT